MALDRDLNVALLRAIDPEAPGRSALELTSATGIRGLRLLAETGRLSRLVLVDRNTEAVRTSARNAAPFASRGARVVQADSFRPPFGREFDYVDIDPFGTPSPYLESALRLLRPLGLLAVTATDMPVLAGVANGVAERRYGGRPVRGRLGPEGGLRLLLADIARRARLHDRRAWVRAAYVHDHHVRAFVTLAPPEGPADPVGVIDPSTFEGPRLPPGPPIGPLWLGPLFDPSVTARLEVPGTAARAKEAAKWVARFREEGEISAPFYYEPNRLAQDLKLSNPPSTESLLRGLALLGHPAARTHVRDGAIRTTAPRAIVESVARSG